MEIQGGLRGNAPPGWHADPWRQHDYRYWDGIAWTATVYDAEPSPSAHAGVTSSRRSKSRAWVAVLVGVSLFACAMLLLGLVALRPVLFSTPPSEEMVVASRDLVASGSAVSTLPVVPADPKTERQRLLVVAFSMCRTPFETGAEQAFADDCSGFTQFAYARIGVELPDDPVDQAEGERPLADLSDLTPGDLVFYRWTRYTGIQHVTMYAGDGWVIGSGTKGVPPGVVLYPISLDLKNDGRVLTYRHIVLADER